MMTMVFYWFGALLMLMGGASIFITALNMFNFNSGRIDVQSVLFWTVSELSLTATGFLLILASR